MEELIYIKEVPNRGSGVADDKMTTKVVPKVVPDEKAFHATERPTYVSACKKAG